MRDGQTFTRETDSVSLAPVVEALHTVYRDHLAPAVMEATGVALPAALIVPQRSQRAWGHITTRPVWEATTEDLDLDYPYGGWAMSMGAPMTVETVRGFHEIMVSGENLARGAVAVFGTLAHEAAHAYNMAAGIRDVDSNGRHNGRFRDAAQGLFGLSITKVSESIGWSHTEVPEAAQERWADAIALIAAAIVASAPREGFGSGSGFGTFGGSLPKSGPGSRGGQGRNKNLLKAVCGCGDSIRASRKVLDKGVGCEECGEHFLAV